MEPGSYSVAPGVHSPAIANFKRSADGEWEYYFVLVNPDEDLMRREHAQLTAAQHLEHAFEEKDRGGSDVDVAMALRAKGYASVDDFLIADSEDGVGFSLYQTGYDEELGYNPRAQAAVLEIVDNQLRDDDPPETRQAFERMARQGYSEEEAKKRIALLVAVGIFDVVKSERDFDHEGYVESLKRLPDLPEDLTADGEDA